MNPSWPDIEAFYREDERREHSVEKDLPGMWFMDTWEGRYRLAWVVQTGELIAIEGDGGRVELLGWVVSYERALKVMDGWTTHTGRLRGFYYLRQQVHRRKEDGKVIEGFEVTGADRDRAAADAGGLF